MNCCRLQINLEKRYELINKKSRATFSDFEGEILYCLIRDENQKYFMKFLQTVGIPHYILPALSGKIILVRFFLLKLNLISFHRKLRN